MGKKYITPSIKTREIDTDNLLQTVSGIGINDKVGDPTSLGKQNFFSTGEDEDAQPVKTKGSSVWGWHEDDIE